MLSKKVKYCKKVRSPTQLNFDPQAKEKKLDIMNFKLAQKYQWDQTKNGIGSKYYAVLWSIDINNRYAIGANQNWHSAIRNGVIG